MKNNSKLALVIGLALIISSIILGTFFYQARKPQNTIKVVGIASQQFTADTIKWVLTLEEETAPDALQSGHQKLQEQYATLVKELEKIGINTDDIIKKPINMYKEYNYNAGPSGNERVFKGYRLTQGFFIITDKLEQIEELALNPIQLLKKDVVINNSSLEYYYSKIDDLKKEIIAQAAVNAKERALKMLENTDNRLGKMTEINSGVFQITEPYSTRVSSGGIYETSTKEKQIKVTAHAVFELK